MWSQKKYTTKILHVYVWCTKCGSHDTCSYGYVILISVSSRNFLKGGQSKISRDRMGASIRLVRYIWKCQGGGGGKQISRGGGAKAPSRPPNPAYQCHVGGAPYFSKGVGQYYIRAVFHKRPSRFISTKM